MAEPDPDRGISRLLAAIGIVLLGLCVLTAIRRQDVLAGGLAVLGLGAIALAVLAPRLTGAVEVGLSGFKLNLVEQLSKAGEAAGYSEAEILEAIRTELSRPLPPPPPPLPPPPEPDETSTVDVLDVPDDAPESAGTDKAQLAQALLQRWKRTGSMSDLGEAVARAEEAVAATPPESYTRAPILLMLGRVLLQRYVALGDAEDLDRSIAVHPQRPGPKRLVAAGACGGVALPGLRPGCSI